ncbi:ABC transporter ATP-binding protein [Aeromicrobium piscarium]|uniref:ABC transporter ATP-binding protein n=1 Tax=Aeromicrobium piscarium TaxID=2590901 RepID=UPI001C8F7E5D|nr:ABC transporter ATP-binding protein [Aeromicrobium piscarium]
MDVVDETGTEAAPLLRVRDLSVRVGEVTPVRGVDLDLPPGGRMAVVGESGSGKSLTALAIMGLLKPPLTVEGSIVLDGVELLDLSPRQLAAMRGGSLAMVYQDPMSSLNPVYSIGRQIVECIRLHEDVSRAVARRRAIDLLHEVGIADPERRVDSYPHELSGGMRQRVMIAMALSAEPKLLIADEPTTALDVTTQARIVDLMRRISEDRGTAVVFITHDLAIAARFCDQVAVMYGGRVVEFGEAEPTYDDPRHPYTRALLGSMCRLDGDVNELLPTIPGSPPLPAELPTGCSFRPRCPRAEEVCAEVFPPTVITDPGPRPHGAECHFAQEGMR